MNKSNQKYSVNACSVYFLNSAHTMIGKILMSNVFMYKEFVKKSCMNSVV